MDRRINTVLLAIAALAAVLQFVAFPLLVPVTAASAVALIALSALTAPLCWGLMHESIHNKLFASDRANRIAGRLLGIALCLVWDMMRFGHLMHHRANRHDHDRPEDVAPGRSRLAAAPVYFLTLLGGGTLQNAVAPAAVFLPLRTTDILVERIFGREPGMRDAALRAFTDPERRARIRADFLAILALIAVSGWCWEAHWPVLAACVLARFAVLSILDNAPHYGTPRDSGTRAYNTTLPPAFRWLVLNANFHGVHHHAPQLAWTELPRAFPGGFDGSWTAMVLRQFRGPMRLSELPGPPGA
ncbi:MAG TPA: fatty acid desaturase [Rhizomicrobium sp.]|jgi:fatty acid desaturase|nr:fatty acid desaturase [Rhizomicrobium sp.]